MAVSLTTNQRAARLDGKKSIHLPESETNVSSAIISFGQEKYPSQCQVLLRSGTLHGSSSVLQK